MAEWAKDKTKWRTLKFDEYGFHATVQVKVIKALGYKAGKDRLLTIVLVRDRLGQRPAPMFYCSHLRWGVHRILSSYARRRSIETVLSMIECLLGAALAQAATGLASGRCCSEPLHTTS